MATIVKSIDDVVAFKEDQMRLINDLDSAIIAQEKYLGTLDTKLSKAQRTGIHELKNQKALMIKSTRETIRKDIFAYLVSISKTDAYLTDDIQRAYVLLSLSGRMLARYGKVPHCWLNLGLGAGLLEDLVVIMRTPSQIGVSDSHLVSSEELISGYYTYLEKNSGRFIFMDYLWKEYQEDSAGLLELIHSYILRQSPSDRIGIYQEDGRPIIMPIRVYMEVWNMILEWLPT